MGGICPPPPPGDIAFGEPTAIAAMSSWEALCGGQEDTRNSRLDSDDDDDDAEELERFDNGG